MYNIKDIGSLIKKSRIDKKMSQEALSELIEITPTHLKHIESGHRKPSIEVLFAIFNALDISFEELKSEKENLTVNLSKINVLLDSCNEKELDLIYNLLKAVKDSKL